MTDPALPAITRDDLAQLQDEEDSRRVAELREAVTVAGASMLKTSAWAKANGKGGWRGVRRLARLLAGHAEKLKEARVEEREDGERVLVVPL